MASIDDLILAQNEVALKQEELEDAKDKERMAQANAIFKKLGLPPTTESKLYLGVTSQEVVIFFKELQVIRAKHFKITASVKGVEISTLVKDSDDKQVKQFALAYNALKGV